MLLLVVAAAGCRLERRPPPPAAGVPAAGPAPSPLAYRALPDSLIPEGPLGEAIRRGRAILLATKDSLPGHVGNGLRCTSCHLDAGTRPGAGPWLGVTARFPQYRSRNDRINSLEDRINDCFERSMAGTALPAGSGAMQDIIAYFAWLSRGVPVGAAVEGEGYPRLDPLAGDTGKGRDIFSAQCARCHGPNGEGLRAGPVIVGAPLWGDSSFTIGAGMARVRTAAAFIRANMPFDTPGVLTDQQAFDVAAYITARPRPDFAGKEYDWPLGNPPPDVAYPTRAAHGR